MAHHSQLVLIASTLSALFLTPATSVQAQQRHVRIVSALEQVQWRAEIEASGTLPFLTDLIWHERGFYGKVKNIAAFTAFLEGQLHIGQTGIFRRGFLHGEHKDIGPRRLDFRSDRGSLGPGSMQVVFSRLTGVVFLDVDLYNPYEDIYSFVGHANEVLHNRFRVRQP